MFVQIFEVVRSQTKRVVRINATAATNGPNNDTNTAVANTSQQNLSHSSFIMIPKSNCRGFADEMLHLVTS